VPSGLLQCDRGRVLALEAMLWYYAKGKPRDESWTRTPPDLPPAPPVQFNNVTLVPVERLTDEELQFYITLAEKGRAMPLELGGTGSRPRRLISAKRTTRSLRRQL
jgi:hypothetical protein